MKIKRPMTLLISMILISIFISSCIGGGAASPAAPPTSPVEPTTAPATSTPLPTQPPTVIPTDTPVPSPTPMPSSTPVQGQFLNRPAYLQEIFSGVDWTRKDTSEESFMILPVRINPSTAITIAFDPDPETADYILFQVDCDIDPEARTEVEAAIQELIGAILKKFLPSSAREDLMQFITEHPDSGTYESTIDGFDVNLMILDNTEKSQHKLILMINEKED